MNFGEKFTVGRIAGLPIVIDPSFILLVILYGWGYLTVGRNDLMLLGVGVVIGGIGSILIHELAHAWAGRIARMDPTHVELNGLGGLCFFSRQAHARHDDIFVTLAGPASNLALWALFHWLGQAVIWSLYGFSGDVDPETIGDQAWYPAAIWAMQLCSTLGTLNMAMFVFNMLPAFPLDGGRALSEGLSGRFGHAAACRFVSCCGFVLVALLVYWGIKGSIWSLILALHLFIANRDMLARSGRAGWQRWN